MSDTEIPMTSGPPDSGPWDVQNGPWFGRPHKPKRLSMDYETYSDVDLPKSGLYKYVRSPSFAILLLAYAFDDDEVSIVDVASGEKIPEDVLAAIQDPAITKCAWNAAFERTVSGKYLGHVLDPEGWECSMVLAASLSLPLALKNSAIVLKTGEQKDKRGEALIKKFSLPQKDRKTGKLYRVYPSDALQDWLDFKEYCLQDVRTERDIRRKLDHFPMLRHEWEAYWNDQRINDRGVLIDMDLVTHAIECDLMLTDEMTKKAYELTGLENPNSVSQLKRWLEERGIEVDTLGKKNVGSLIAELDKNGADQTAIDMLKLRLQMAKSSVKKYQAAERCVCDDDRARGLFMFMGANRTGRWAGRLLQLQNLSKNHIDSLEEARGLLKGGYYDMLASIYGDVPDILSQLVRTMLVPRDGCEFIIADFSAIECRVLAWEAGEDWVLDSFRDGKDIYCSTASSMFHVPVEKHGQNAELRQKGKIATLACGYSGNVNALISMGALDMGLKEDELPDIIDSWRKANPKIVQYWWDVEKAAVETLKDHQEHSVRMLSFQFYANTLWMVLPSGRKLAYMKPKLMPNRFGRMSVTFEGVGMGNHWERQETYSGKLVENATQAIARDLLSDAMLRLADHGIDVVAHIHDECICEVPKDKYTVDEVCSIMSETPDWAAGLPLSAAGYKGAFYYKD